MILTYCFVDEAVYWAAKSKDSYLNSGNYFSDTNSDAIHPDMDFSENDRFVDICNQCGIN